jgi:hypothetical protein
LSLLPCGFRNRDGIVCRWETLSIPSCSPLRSSTSLGVSKDRPSVDINLLRPLLRLPSCEVAFTFWVCASACSCRETGLVPSSRFLAVLMVCSAESLAGLLHPAANHGVRRVSGLFQGSLAGSVTEVVPTGASTLRSFSLAISRLPVFPFWGGPAFLLLHDVLTDPKISTSFAGHRRSCDPSASRLECSS